MSFDRFVIGLVHYKTCTTGELICTQARWSSILISLTRNLGVVKSCHAKLPPSHERHPRVSRYPNFRTCYYSPLLFHPYCCISLVSTSFSAARMLLQRREVDRQWEEHSAAISPTLTCWFQLWLRLGQPTWPPTDKASARMLILFWKEPPPFCTQRNSLLLEAFLNVYRDGSPCIWWSWI